MGAIASIPDRFPGYNGQSSRLPEQCNLHHIHQHQLHPCFQVHLPTCPAFQSVRSHHDEFVGHTQCRCVVMESVTAQCTMSNQQAPCRRRNKPSRLATFKKRMSRWRRRSGQPDFGRALRDTLSAWQSRDVQALYAEFEAQAALRELYLAAAVARPIASTVRADLALLFDDKFCADATLMYCGVAFPVHKALLSVRCPLFKSLFERHAHTTAASIPVDIRTAGIDLHMFGALLKYLYTGEIRLEESRLENLELLAALCDEFGTPNLLEADLRRLLDTGIGADCWLVWPSAVAHVRALELPCHRFILAARSRFFRALVARREHCDLPCRIVLDEHVLPHRFAHVLLRAIYLDSVDLLLQQHQQASALVADMALLDEHQMCAAMELYQIGQFLEFNALSQGCEDILFESLSANNLIPVLRWSGEPYGSAWLHRQARLFLREEFLHVAHSNVLFELSRRELAAAIKCDFTQAPESEILASIVRWGEHHLIRLREERDAKLMTSNSGLPGGNASNVSSAVSHNRQKSSSKRFKDLNDAELAELLSDLLIHVRLEHYLPGAGGQEALTNVMKRRLIRFSDNGDDAVSISNIFAQSSRPKAWLTCHRHRRSRPPRLFSLFHDEIRNILLEQQPSNVVANADTHHQASPSSLSQNFPTSSSIEHVVSCHPFHQQRPPPYPMDVLPPVAPAQPLLDRRTVATLRHRVHDLYSAPIAQRAYRMLCAERQAVLRQVQLQAVRELGLPDTAAQLLITGVAPPPGHSLAVATAADQHAANAAVNVSSRTVIAQQQHVQSPSRHQEEQQAIGLPDLTAATYRLDHLSLQADAARQGRSEVITSLMKMRTHSCHLRSPAELLPSTWHELFGNEEQLQ